MAGAAARSGLRRRARHHDSQKRAGARASFHDDDFSAAHLKERAAISSTLFFLFHNRHQTATPFAASPHERCIVPHPLVHAPGGVGDSWRRVASGSRASGQAQQAGGAVAKRVHLLGVLVNEVACKTRRGMQPFV